MSILHGLSPGTAVHSADLSPPGLAAAGGQAEGYGRHLHERPELPVPLGAHPGDDPHPGGLLPIGTAHVFLVFSLS